MRSASAPRNTHRSSISSCAYIGLAYAIQAVRLSAANFFTKPTATRTSPTATSANQVVHELKHEEANRQRRGDGAEVIQVGGYVLGRARKQGHENASG